MVGRLAVLAVLAAALVGGAPARAAIPRELAQAGAQFDLFTGVWVEEGATPERRLVLRQLPSGELQGIFWNTGGEPPDPETLDPEFFDLEGHVDPDGTNVAEAGLSIPGGLAPVELEVFTSSYPWTVWLREPGAGGPGTKYRYESGGDNRAVLGFARSWEPRPARRGDRVRIQFELEGLGPRGVSGGAVRLTVLVPRAVGKAKIKAVRVSGSARPGCLGDANRRFWVVACAFGAIRNGNSDVSVDVSVPESFSATYLKVYYELALRKGWQARSGLDAILVSGADPEGVLKIPVLRALPDGGGGDGGGTGDAGGGGDGGGGDGGDGGGGDGGGASPPSLTPVTDELLKKLVCLDVTIGGEPLRLASAGGFNPDLQSGFACGYASQIGANVGGIQAQYTRSPGGVDYCRSLDSDGYLQGTKYHVQVFVPDWFDDAATLRRTILANLENAGIALPCQQ